MSNNLQILEQLNLVYQEPLKAQKHKSSIRHLSPMQRAQVIVKNLRESPTKKYDNKCSFKSKLNEPITRNKSGLQNGVKKNLNNDSSVCLPNVKSSNNPKNSLMIRQS